MEVTRWSVAGHVGEPCGRPPWFTVLSVGHRGGGGGGGRDSMSGMGNMVHLLDL